MNLHEHSTLYLFINDIHKMQALMRHKITMARNSARAINVCDSRVIPAAAGASILHV